MEKDPGSCTVKLVNIDHAQQQNAENRVDLANVPYTINKKKNLFKRYPWKRKDYVKSYRKKRVSIGHVFYLFCTTTSIRGMNRIPKGPIFLRLLWISFVLIMTTGLSVATFFMVVEYLQYDVNVNTKINLDDNSSFPALTICHHHPFSRKAYKLWDAGQVLSPSEYNRNIRKMANSSFQNNDYNNGFISSNLDTMSMYYQNLKMNDSTIIGHDKHVYLICMNQMGLTINFDNDCSILRNISFHRISHHEYFNCHTFQPEDLNVSYSMDSINIVVSLDPKPDYRKHEQAFIVETFQRAEGLRVVVHETQSFPDIAQDGLHVEPGKMNEIKYQPVKHRKVNSPSKPCVEPGDIKTFKDLEHYFFMDKPNCISMKRQERIINECKCMFISFPRPQSPTPEIPYCGEIPENKNITSLMDRIDCITNIISDPDFQDYLEKTACFPRCDSLIFESTISITKWGATPWHLHWIRQTNKALNLAKNSDTVMVNETEGFKMWLEYANKQNLSDIKSLKNDDFLKGENFAYVVLQRKSRKTILRQEKLVTTPYVLLSRVGGVCSLTIGLTAAFVVEFIEFIYKFCNHTEEGGQFCQNKSSIKSQNYIKNASTKITKKESPMLKQDTEVRTFKDSSTIINQENSDYLVSA